MKVNNKIRGFGTTDTEKKTIEINRKRSKSTHNPGELLDTLKHEVNHARHPKMGERKIYHMTAKQKLSKGAKQKLYNLIKK